MTRKLVEIVDRIEGVYQCYQTDITTLAQQSGQCQSGVNELRECWDTTVKHFDVKVGALTEVLAGLPIVTEKLQLLGEKVATVAQVQDDLATKYANWGDLFDRVETSDARWVDEIRKFGALRANDLQRISQLETRLAESVATVHALQEHGIQSETRQGQTVKLLGKQVTSERQLNDQLRKELKELGSVVRGGEAWSRVIQGQLDRQWIELGRQGKGMWHLESRMAAVEQYSLSTPLGSKGPRGESE